uniref:Uncharacterized protein n=1 Tax=Rhizophora mucronata TaxID=61149 RepID=A0A2P2QNV0_RHIMU
MYSGARYLWTS